jgi:hypothetical protein
VKHYASSRFWRLYRALPKDVQELADAKYALLKADPAHPSLHFKKIGSYWSVRVGLHYRALAIDAEFRTRCVATQLGEPRVAGRVRAV